MSSKTSFRVFSDESANTIHRRHRSNARPQSARNLRLACIRPEHNTKLVRYASNAKLENSTRVLAGPVTFELSKRPEVKYVYIFEKQGPGKLAITLSAPSRPNLCVPLSSPTLSKNAANSRTRAFLENTGRQLAQDWLDEEIKDAPVALSRSGTIGLLSFHSSLAIRSK